MHLSVLSDCFVSDALKDAGRGAAAPSQAHRDSLLRGLALVAIAGVLVGLTVLADIAQPAAADPSPRMAAISSGAAVNLMHREVTGH